MRCAEDAMCQVVRPCRPGEVVPQFPSLHPGGEAQLAVLHESGPLGIYLDPHGMGAGKLFDWGI